MLQVEARRQELIEEFGMTEEELDAIPELRYDESQDELRKYLRLNSQLNDSKMWWSWTDTTKWIVFFQLKDVQ